jgi:hypothetical protein
LNVFGVKLQNCRQQSLSTFLNLFIITNIITLTHPFEMPAVEIDGSLLCKMQGKERNERHQRNNDEKRPTGNPGRVPNLRNQDVQDRQEQIRLPLRRL